MKKRVADGSRLQKIILGGAAILVFLIIWQLAVSPDNKKFTTPGNVIIFIFEHLTHNVGQYTIIGHICFSLSRVMVGYLLAAALGIVTALLMSQFKTLEAVILPIFNLLRPIPPIGWIPLAILWFGIQESSKYFIIFISAFVPFVMNTYIGAKRVDKRLVDAALMLGTSPGKLFTKITFPAIVPQIFAGAQVALTNAWMAVIGAELVRSTEGAGWMIMKGMESANMAQIVAGMVVIGLTGFVIITLMRFLERHLIRWNVRGR